MKKIRVEYPDKTIHYIECYRFARSILPNNLEQYFIEYYDVTDEKEYKDSYALLELKEGKWYKKSNDIPYNLISNNVREELSVEELPEYIINLEIENFLVQPSQQQEETINKSKTEPEEIIYIPVIVDEETKLLVYPTLPTIKGYSLFSINTDRLDDKIYSEIAIRYRNQFVKNYIKPGILEYSYFEYHSLKIPKEVENYFYEHINRASQNGEYLEFSELKDVKIGNKTYRFIKDINKVDYKMYDNLKIFINLETPDVSSEELLQNFLYLHSPIALGEITINGLKLSEYTGLTKEKEIEILEQKVQMYEKQTYEEQKLYNR